MTAEPKDAEFIHAAVERARLGPIVVREAVRGLPEDDARRKPGVGKLSITEHLWHMLEMEREVFKVRLRRVLAEDNPKLSPVNQEHFVEETLIAGQAYSDLLDDWERLREENVQLVLGTGETEWKRPVRHPDLGDKATFADVVGRWSRHDAEHVRQIEILARNAHERNLPGTQTGTQPGNSRESTGEPHAVSRAGRHARWAAPLLAAVVALAAGRPATAAPSIGEVRSTVIRGRKVALTVETTLGARGTVVVEGRLNGRTVRSRKRIAAGARTVTLSLDPKKARIRRADGPITFDVTATVSERGGATDERTLQATIGVPLLVLPGFGDPTTQSTLDGLVAALDAAAGGAWGTDGKRPLAALHPYDAVAESVPAIAQGVDAAARKLLRGTPFRRVDVVGYSMGGLVAREWIAGAGEGRVRRLVFLGAPNEGIPTVALLLFASESGLLDTLLASAAGGVDLGALGLGDLLDADTAAALTLFLPTYDWAFADFGFGVTVPVNGLLSLDVPPLRDLNATAPDPALDAIHSFTYTSVLPGDLGLPAGTLDEVDLTPLLAAGGLGGGGGGLDFTDPEAITALFSGSGDGLVPSRSAWMDDVISWSGSPKFTKHDLGAGTHLTYGADPRVVSAVVDVLTK